MKIMLFVNTSKSTLNQPISLNSNLIITVIKIKITTIMSPSITYLIQTNKIIFLILTLFHTIFNCSILIPCLLLILFRKFACHVWKCLGFLCLELSWLRTVFSTCIAEYGQGSTACVKQYTHLLRVGTKVEFGVIQIISPFLKWDFMNGRRKRRVRTLNYEVQNRQQ